MSIRIGLARADDVAAIARMSRLLIEAGLPWSWNEIRVRHYVRDADSAVIVARDRRRVVGFAIMQFLDAHAHLNLLAVNPGNQHQGIGRALIEWLEASARTAGIFDIRLEMRAGNQAARAFYERLGYLATGRRVRYYAGLEDALCMTRDLTVVRAPRS
jgi:[ribosomal protein S18]-alanine N-acetyltransferase